MFEVEEMDAETIRAESQAADAEADRLMELLRNATADQLPELLAILRRFADEDGGEAMAAGLASVARLVLPAEARPTS